VKEEAVGSEGGEGSVHSEAAVDTCRLTCKELEAVTAASASVEAAGKAVAGSAEAAGQEAAGREAAGREAAGRAEVAATAAAGSMSKARNVSIACSL